MTLTELRYIVALARERHFGRAAEASFVSQPTLSVAIRKLEDELGVSMFERRPNEVALTPIGERIVAQAVRVLEEVRVLKELARDGEDPLAAPLRLGAIYTIGPYLFPTLIPALRGLAPQMPLLVEENLTVVLAERLKQGQLDAIIVSEPFQEPGIITLALYDEPFVVALPPEHPWTAQATIASERLAEETALLLSTGNCFRDQVLKACPDLNRGGSGELQRTLEGSSLETIRYMVATGVGITVLPCSAAQRTGQGEMVTTRPFAAPLPKRRIVLAWRNQFPRQQAIEILQKAIRACPLACVDWVGA